MILDDKVKTEETVNQKQENKIEKLGSIRILKGHKFFSFNKVTKEVIEEAVEITEDLFNPNGDIKTKNKKVIEPNKLYFSSLNMKNAKRKLKKYGYL